VFPINKKLWTSSFVMFTGGAAACMLALFMWLIDLRGSRWWTEPFQVFGLNPILAFFGSNIFALLIYVDFTVTRHGNQIAPEEWLNDVFLASWLPAKIASLAFALLFVTLWWAILRVFLKRGILIKV
jgi:predicted acyltransferase